MATTMKETDGEPDREAERYIPRRATIRELHLGPRRYSSEPNIISSGTRSGSRVRETEMFGGPRTRRKKGEVYLRGAAALYVNGPP